MKLKKIKINNSIFLLIMIFIDVFVKIIIDNFFMEDKLFINDKLGFLPYLNTEQLSIWWIRFFGKEAWIIYCFFLKLWI